MKPSKAKFYARRFLAGEAIPIFTFKSDNRAIDAEVVRILEARGKHIFRRKRDRQLMRGGTEC